MITLKIEIEINSCGECPFCPDATIGGQPIYTCFHPNIIASLGPPVPPPNWKVDKKQILGPDYIPGNKLTYYEQKPPPKHCPLSSEFVIKHKGTGIIDILKKETLNERHLIYRSH